VVVSLVLLPIPWLIGFAAYPAGFWWPIIASEVALALSLVGALVYNYATEGKQKAFIKQAFKYYLSSDVIDRLIDDPSQLQLGGGEKGTDHPLLRPPGIFVYLRTYEPGEADNSA